MSNIEIGCMNDNSVWGDQPGGDQRYDDPYKSTVNPIIWKHVPGSEYTPDEMMPYLMFAPHCEVCGKPVESYDGVPVGWIYPYEAFFCTFCHDMDCAYFLYMVRQMQSGAWSEEQAEAFMMSLWKDDGPYY